MQNDAIPELKDPDFPSLTPLEAAQRKALRQRLETVAMLAILTPSDVAIIPAINANGERVFILAVRDGVEGNKTKAIFEMELKLINSKMLGPADAEYTRGLTFEGGEKPTYQPISRTE